MSSRRRLDRPSLYSTAGDPYSRAGKKCSTYGVRPLWIDRVPYCARCGRSVFKSWRRYMFFEQERFKEIWIHKGPIFSTSAGC